MLAIIKGWLTSNALQLAGYLAAALSVVAVLFGARQAGKTAERVDIMKKTLEVKDAQLHAAAAAPHTRGDLVDRLRAGKF